MTAIFETDAAVPPAARPAAPALCVTPAGAAPIRALRDAAEDCA